MKLARCLFAVFLALRAVPAAADTLTDLLPPDTKVVFGIRVHNLAISSVAQTFAVQAQAAAAGWLQAVPLHRIDFLRDIDEILIASTGKAPNPPSLAVVTGRFNVASLAEGARRYHDVPLLVGEKETDSVFALLDTGTALIGNPALVRAAIDQRGGENRIDPALNDRITSLRQRYDIWGLGERPQGFVAPIFEVEVVESIDRFQFGMQLASGLELSAEIHARTPQGAEKLNAAVRKMAALVKGPETSASAAKFETRSEGETLKLSVTIPDEELKRTIVAEMAALSPLSAEQPASATIGAPGGQETGPDGAPEAPALTQEAASAPPAPAQASRKPPTTKLPDQAVDTVILTLPGKK
jgi:hypothetical protein